MKEISKTPEQMPSCDNCSVQAVVIYDTPTQHGGPWGYLCQECMDKIGLYSSVTTKLVRDVRD
jgi:hypothetical protein